MLIFSPEAQGMLAQGPVEGVAHLVAGQARALRDAIIRAVLEVGGESDLVAQRKPPGIGGRVVGRERRN